MSLDRHLIWSSLCQALVQSYNLPRLPSFSFACLSIGSSVVLPVQSTAYTNLILIGSSLTILPMTVLAATGNRSIPYVSLARERIINPLTVIHSAFEPMDARTWINDPEESFSPAKEEDRLNVGPMLMDNGAIAFGVSRRRLA